jgi:hypothetical protein
MIEPALGALLVASIGGPPLPAAGLLAAGSAAVAVSSIAVSADEEERSAPWAQADPLPQNRFAVNHAMRQRRRDRDWTTAVVSWQVRTSSVWFDLSKVAEHGTLPLERQGSSPSRLKPRYWVQPGWWMTGLMIAPSAR